MTEKSKRERPDRDGASAIESAPRETTAEFRSRVAP